MEKRDVLLSAFFVKKIFAGRRTNTSELSEMTFYLVM